MSHRSFRRTTWISLVGGALLAALASFGLTRCGGEEVEGASSALAISAPDEVVAGVRLDVVVSGDGPGNIELEVIDAFVTTTLTEPIIGGRSIFTLPGALSELSGMLTLRARGDLGEAVVANTRIVPAAVSESIDIHTGPRTIVADGADQTMAIGIPSDVFGNPLIDGTEVVITRLDSAGNVSPRRAVVEGGLAALLISSDTTAGRIEVFAALSTDTATNSLAPLPASRRVDYHEVPGWATAVELRRADGDVLVADGSGVVELRTMPISDRFGNQLLDGHLVKVRVDGQGGSGQLTARTIDGIARFELPVPDRPGTTTLTALVGDAESAPIELDFAVAISSLPLDVFFDDTRLSVAVGPVLDAAGAVVTDGTLATVTGLPGREPVELQLIRGRATVVVEDAGNEQNSDAQDGDEIRVSVLGVSTTGDVR